MSSIAFDTHAFVKELTRAGMPEEQAEVLARSQAALIDEKLATKQDLEKLELALKQDLEKLEVALRQDLKELEMAGKQDLKETELALRQDLEKLELALRQDLKELELAGKQDLKELELRLTIRLGSMIVVGVGAVAALVKLL